ncbi:unnamed protein product [Laminaria digitata]
MGLFCQSYMAKPSTSVVTLETECNLAYFSFSMNHIGDGGAAIIAEALRQPSCCLRKIDLRGNQMSMEGVRVLAKALEENVSRGISHVYVHNEGRIDALARQGGDAIHANTTKGNNQAAADQDSATPFVSIAVVDVRNNKPRKMNSGTRKTVLPVNCRGKRQGGGVGLAAGRSGREAVSNGISRQGRKGDSVSISRQRDVRDFMTKAAYVDGGGRSQFPVP